MIPLIYFIIGAAAGAAAGSFLGVVIDRSSKFIFGRSRCSICGHKLCWWENIPIFSYLLLVGRCRACRAPIPYWLPLIEIAAAITGIWLAYLASQTITVITVIKFIGAAAVAAALIGIFFSDLVKGVVPDWAVALGAAGAAIEKFAKLPITFESFVTLIWPATAAAGFFWLLVAATGGRGMGTGDATLAFFLGLWLEWPKILVGIWLGFLIGAAAAIGLIVAGRKKFGQTVPFGPFLVIGAVIAYFYGEKVLSWFL